MIGRGLKYISPQNLDEDNQMSVTFREVTNAYDSDGKFLGHFDRFSDGSDAVFAPTFKPADDGNTFLTAGELKQIAAQIENLSE